MSAAKSANLPPPTQGGDPPESVNYRFFMKAICVNLCFMTAFTLFIIAIGIIFSLVSAPNNVGVNIPPITTPRPIDPRPSVSVQHFEHMVQNGNQMANQMRYIVPEAQQMLNDAIRIFYETMFKVNSIFVPDLPQNVDFVPVEPLTEAPTTTTTTVALREKRDLAEPEEDEPNTDLSILSALPRKQQQDTCPHPPSKELKILQRIFPQPPPINREKRELEETIFDPLDLDPLNLEMWNDQNSLLDNSYDDEVDEEVRNKIRKKRRAELRIRQLKEDYVRCKKLAKTNDKCKDIYNEVLQVMGSLKQNMNSMQDLLRNTERSAKVEREGGKLQSGYKFVRPTTANENTLQPGLSPQEDTFRSTQPQVGFHEDMGAVNEEIGEPRQWIDTTKFINQLTNQKIHNNAPSQKFAPATTLIVNQRQQSGDSPKTNSQPAAMMTTASQGTQSSDFVAASGPFISLCEKYARQGGPNLNTLNANQANGQNMNQNQNNNNNNNNNGNQNQQQNPLNVQNTPSFIGFTSFSPQQFTNRGVVGGGSGLNVAPGSVPITGESMQATAKVLFNPGGIDLGNGGSLF